MPPIQQVQSESRGEHEGFSRFVEDSAVATGAAARIATNPFRILIVSLSQVNWKHQASPSDNFEMGVVSCAISNIHIRITRCSHASTCSLRK